MSTPENDEIIKTLRNFLVDECGLEETGLAHDTLLFSGGLLQSIDVLQLLAFIEDRYDFAVPAAEVGIDQFDSLNRLADFVRSRAGQA